MDTTDAYATLKAAARDAPRESGVYIWRDDEGRPIYVGKAKSLRNRLGNYFSSGSARDVKTAALVRHARSIETIVVANEYEALLLENTLIKQHSPRYNINLKDGKTYPVVRVTAETFPRVFRTRYIVDDGSLYFGPYPDVQAVDRMLGMVEKLFPLRKCRRLRQRPIPCMYFHIGRCAGPCCGRIDAAGYAVQVERVKKLLAGETAALTADLTARMGEAAAALRFEEAAALRDAARAIAGLSEPSSVEDRDPEDRDYLAWAEEGIFTTFSVCSMRGGRMTGRELFSSRSAAAETEALETFVTAYYTPDRPPPPKIFLAAPAGTDFDALLAFFEGQFGYAPALLAPAEKRHEAALAMARQNAVEELRRRQRERGAGPALDELQAALNLPARPERIEGFDIAQLGGKHPVASLISFRDGVPDRRNYRYFKLRTVVGVIDDFQGMREAVRRRYGRLVREGIDLPDLVLVDGGIGQVNAAKGVLDELGVDCPVVGLAKRDEELWLPHAAGPIRLPRRSEALKVLQAVRDETHRFATGLNQRLRTADLRFPTLESVEGIGPVRAAAIMRVYGSIEAVAAAEPDDLAARCGITATLARAVRAAARLAMEGGEPPGASDAEPAGAPGDDAGQAARALAAL